MYMTANRLKEGGKIVLKLNIHDFTENDIPFLDSLQITQTEEDQEQTRYIRIHSQEDFLKTRATILEHYNVLEEKANKVFLEKKQNM